MKEEKKVILTKQPDTEKVKPKEWNPRLYFWKRNLKKF
jgi:hypothetical protein